MKKGWGYVIAILCVLIFCPLLWVIILMLAPGTTIFGVKFISAAVGNYDYMEEISLNTDICLTTYDVPITIKFGAAGDTGVHLVQRYQGFTTSNNTPSISVLDGNGNEYTSNSSGTAYINISQYKKFLWANSSREFYLEIILPMSFNKSNSIEIKSTNSDITLEGQEQNLANLTLNTTGSININNKLTVNGSFKIGIKKAVTLSEKVTLNNVDVSTSSGNFTDNGTINGSVNYTSKSGKLNLKNCGGALTAETSSGSVTVNGSVGGNLKFTSKTGGLSVGNVSGQTIEISNNSGSITLGQASGNVTIITKRANVKLTSAADATITTTTGNINIGAVNGAFKATTTTGNISCTSVTGEAKAVTKSGDITFSGAIGGTANITNQTGQIKLASCMALTASNQTGSIVGYSDSGINVLGKAVVSTTKGKIKLSAVGGDAFIDSTGGTITVNSVTGKLEINKNVSNTNSSAITIGSAGSAEIVGYNSSITLGSSGETTIKTSGGAIKVGESGTVGNLSASSTYGGISAYNTTGSVNISSGSSVTLNNLSSTDITISASKAVTATGLMGSVTVKAKTNINLTFGGDASNVKVTHSGSTGSVNINAECISYIEVSNSYYLYGRSSKVYQGDTLVASGSIIDANNLNPSFYIRGENSAITLKFGA